jgi:hypothetical protein
MTPPKSSTSTFLCVCPTKSSILFLHSMNLYNGLLNQKIISTSFFSKKTCMVPYFFMFFVYLLNSKAIVQPLVNPSLQFYWNTIYILGFPWLRFKVKCSMGWTTIFLMGVLLMILNNVHNIWILAQENLAMHHCFFNLGCFKSSWHSFSPKLQWYLHAYKT